MQTTHNLFVDLLIGAAWGLAGQVIRVLAGLKKLNESNKSIEINTPFDRQRMVVSLLLGIIAGVTGAFILKSDDVPLDWSKKELVLTVIGMGYSGVDFIESLLTKYVTKSVKTEQKNECKKGSDAALHELSLDKEKSQIIEISRKQVQVLPYSSKQT